MRLYEKHRPRTFGEVVGQDKAVKVIESAAKGGRIAGSAWWISGPSGAGKTTLARIIADQIADPFFVREYDSADQLTAGELADLSRSLWLSAWGKGGRAVIVNEAHGLRQDTIRRLLGMLEPVQPHAVWIFTTTWAGEQAVLDGIDAAPLWSRCAMLRLTNQGCAQVFAERALAIARAEGLDGQPIGEYVKLAQRCKNNFRAMLQEIEAGAMIGGAA
jgi:DNA polymerase-3 subunit gamma/tau